MKAVALIRYLPIEDPSAFIDVTLGKPAPGGPRGHDLLVEVKAVAVNPVDTKTRSPNGKEDKIESPPRILGYDASGIVKSVGPHVKLFKPGDEVYYAGDITRPGTNQQFHLVDERIVGRKPNTLSFAEAAALPLTSITAYEAFFARLRIDRNGGNSGETILIIGASGGVGSIGIQLAKAAGLTVIATASRPETQQWVRDLGADHVVNHHGDIVSQIHTMGLKYVDHVAIFNDMNHWGAAVEILRPQGGIVCIDDTHLPMPMDLLKTKAASLHWELMFTRSMYKTNDMSEQHILLNYVAKEIDAGRIKTTVTKVLSPINAKNMREAHRLVETRQAKGKVVVEGW